MRVVSLYRYPVKSLQGEQVQVGRVVSTGFEYDREWVIVEADTQVFVSQRKDPILATLRATVEGGFLSIFRGDDLVLIWPIVAFRRPEVQRSYLVQIHKKREALGIDQGDQPAHALSQIIGRPVRLVKLSAGSRRSSPQRPGAVMVGFADGFPILLASTRSLEDLNRRLDVPVPMNRFRPNIVVDGIETAFDEDDFDRFTIGQVHLQGRTRCTRCPITQTDQETGERFAEPMRTLLTYRVFPDSERPCFGLNVDHLSRGVIMVGDSLTVISRQSQELM